MMFGNFLFDSPKKKNNLVQFNTGKVLFFNLYIDVCLINRKAATKYSQKKKMDEWNRNREMVQTRFEHSHSHGCLPLHHG